MHAEKLKEVDERMEEFRGKIKKEIQNACARSYLRYKNIKKITLEDNIQVQNTDEDKNELEKIKKKAKNKDTNLVKKFIMDNMPYAQDATRR